ncbi:MAG: hypothetical protein JOZ44_06655 [Acidobacteria bacterium]|nr:hypothetical protein [Acidobacteriota bacterium]
MRVALIMALFVFSLFATPQQINQQLNTVSAPGGERPEKKAGKELTVDERKTAASLLKTSEAEARGLPADLRAYALLQVARGYSQIEPTKAPALLSDAFSATLVIAPDDKLAKESLQREILQQLLALDHNKVNEILPQAEEKPRSEITRELVRRDIRAKKLDEAADLIGQISRVSEFPYGEGTELMQAFPETESWRRSAVFAQALSSYASSEHKRAQLGDGFSEMITANWRGLPPEQVEQAIDEVLKQAKNNQQDASVSLASDKGEQANFASLYEFRLFQLLPILREINKGKAEDLLRDEQAVQGLLAKYPNGEDSLAPRPQDASMKGPGAGRNMSMMVRSKDHGGVGASAGPQLPQVDEGQAWQSQADRIVASAADDPKQALAQAQTLPLRANMLGGNFPLRAEAMRGIANSCLKSNPTVAKQAAADMVKALQDVDAKQIQEMLEAAKLYLKLEDPASAKKVLESSVSKANELIKTDESSDDPNRAFKAYWPSAAAWQALLRIAERISPAYAQTTIADISDDEIRVLSRIALADELAGAPAGRVIIAENHGKGNRNMVRMSDSDDDQE